MDTLAVVGLIVGVLILLGIIEGIAVELRYRKKLV